MKKIFVFLIAALVLTSLYGQTEKGRVMLNFSNFSPLVSEVDLIAPTNSFGIAFGTIKEEDEEDIRYSVVGLEGSVHYFLFDNFSAGVNVGFLTENVKSKDDFTQEEYNVTQTLFMGGPELRYYFPLGANNKLYVRGGAGFGSFKTKVEDSEAEANATITEFGGGVGFALFPNENFSINIGAGYGSATTKSEESFFGMTFEDKTTNTGLTIDLGFSIFFGGGD